MTMTTDVHTLSGAYALDALAPDEAADFRSHLASCPSCCDEVRELRDAAARMGAVETLQPPAELRGRVLAAADRTRQDPPKVVPLQRRGSSSVRRRRWDRLALAAAAVFLVGGGAVGLGQVLGDSQDPTLTAAERVFEADDAREVPATTLNGGKLIVAMSPSQDRMAVDTAQLPPLEGGRVYQLWAVDDAGARSVEVIETPGETPVMDLPPQGVQIALTIEPAGGSTEPTHEPIAEVDPASV